MIHRWFSKSNIAIVFVLAILCCVRILAHEIWRDEAQAWLLVTGSKSILSLLSNLRYEIHPPLWYLYLTPFAMVSSSVLSLQIANATISLLTGWLILTNKNWQWSTRVLLLLNSYFLFEFGTMNRSYGLGALLFLGYSLLIHRHQILAGLMLSMLPLTSLFAVILTGGIAVWLVISRRTAFWRSHLAMAALGIMLSLTTMIPPPDYSFGPGVTKGWDPGHFSRAFLTLISSLVPLTPFWQEHDWNRLWLLENGDGSKILVILLLFFVLTRNRKSLLTSYFLPIFSVFLVMLTFMYTMYIGYSRHWSHLFLFIVGMSILESEKANHFASKIKPIVTIGLIVSAISGFSQLTKDLFTPFSRAQDAANVIHQWDQQDGLQHPVFAIDDVTASPISAFLKRPINYAPTGSPGTFIVWNKSRRKTPEELNVLFYSEFNQQKSDWIAITPIDFQLSLDWQGQVIESVTLLPGQISDEGYRIYRFSPKNPHID